MGVSGAKSGGLATIVAPPPVVKIHGVQATNASEALPLQDREQALVQKFMLDHMRLKVWAAEDGNSLRELLRHEDNAAHANATTAFIPMQLPKDADGFVEAFEPIDTDGIQAFFDKYGLVVVRAVVSAEACARSRDEFWDLMERECKALDRDDARTWEKWSDIKTLGFVGMTFPLSPQLCKNRIEPRVHAAFSAVFGRPDLHVNIGRLGAMRPTRSVPTGEPPGRDGRPAVTDKPEWRTTHGSAWLHWDLNPWTGAVSSFSWHLPDPLANRGYSHKHLAVQAVLALRDCAEQDGGFLCVPGSHKICRGWAHLHRNEGLEQNVQSPESSMQYQLPQDDPIAHAIDTAPIREGDLLIWSAELAHANYPNDSSSMRLVQYIQMKPASDQILLPLLDDASLLPPASEFEVTPLGRKLMGHELW